MPYPQLGSSEGSTVGAGAGTVIAGPVGATIGGIIGSLFGGTAGVQNPGGPTAFARWANEGHYDWVASVALNKSGPNWQLDPGDTGTPWKTGYSPADAASATQILAQHGLTPQQALSMSKGATVTQASGGTVVAPVTAPTPAPGTLTPASLVPAGLTNFLTTPVGLGVVALSAFLLLKRKRR